MPNIANNYQSHVPAPAQNRRMGISMYRFRPRTQNRRMEYSCAGSGPQPAGPEPAQSRPLAIGSVSKQWLSGMDFGRTDTGNAPKSAFLKFRSLAGSNPAKIRPELPTYGPEELFHNIEYILVSTVPGRPRALWGW